MLSVFEETTEKIRNLEMNGLIIKSKKDQTFLCLNLFVVVVSLNEYDHDIYTIHENV